MNYHTLSYLLYLLIAVPLTLWVARTLHANGRVFLVEAFEGKEGFADSINHLLVVGFYLINVGFVLLYLKHEERPEGMGEVIETVATRVGLVMLVLGGMHFLNLYIFNRMRKRVVGAGETVIPVLPTARLATGPGTVA